MKLILESGLGACNLRCKIKTAYIFCGEMKDQLRAYKYLKILKIPKNASESKNCYELSHDNLFCHGCWQLSDKRLVTHAH